MSLYEFTLKTCLFLLLPGLIGYGCLRLQEESTLAKTHERTCLMCLQQATPTAMTLVGQADEGRLLYKQVLNPAVLRQFQVLVQGLSPHPLRVQAGGYRRSTRRYQLVLVWGRDTCEHVLHKMPLGEVALWEVAGDSAYEAPKLVPFLDSVFRSKTLTKTLYPGNDTYSSERWLQK
ncbi:hypothetical protein DNI29_18050 [Hymenobacter sediminis]|uniref:hypothetical protein n=1 Tax=Hymenobacter sediminis TaxID=2218621 RepID=UPI000DA6C319|nr:hypothetical protein [Hymenobacter sediminis]RPD45289.1 hypothetical protein DNI29_18050 [Hymenobacter sediminis]